jgi:DNA anti-recombination protein RmuC
MLTRFWFQKERKLRNNEQMSDDEGRNLADFTNFVKTLTEDLRSLLSRFQSAPGRIGEEFDKEIEQMEISVKNRLKEFDEVLNGTNKTLRSRLGESVGNVISRIGMLSHERLFSGALNINVADSDSEKQEREIHSKRVG